MEEQDKKYLEEKFKAIDKKFENVVTKDDLKNFATKDDFKAFPTKADLDERLANFATRDDLRNFATKSDVWRLEEKIDDIQIKVTRIDVRTDEDIRAAYKDIEKLKSRPR